MRKTIRLVPLLLFAVIIIGSVAAAPAVLSKPGKPTVKPTANAGELQVSWSPVAGAQHYTVGYANPDEMSRMSAAGRNSLDAFYYITIGADNTSHTLTGLEPETVYWVVVGAQTKRFGATDLVWSQYAEATTAGQHAAGFCPITGLPIPAGGYLKVGDTKRWTDATFRLDSVTTPASVPTVTGIYTPQAGRKLLKLCGTRSNQTGDDWYFQAGAHNNLSTDHGIGFARVKGWGDTPLPNGQTDSACDTWSVPDTAITAVYALKDGSRPDVLYRIDLATIPASSTTTTTKSTTPFNLDDYKNGEWLAYYHSSLASRLQAIPWVQDGVTETESETVQELLYLAVYDATAMGQVMAMPFMQTFETADRHAVDGITAIFRDQLGANLKGTRVYRNGITDKLTPVVAAAAATESAGAIAEYLDAGQGTMETKTYSTTHTANLTVSIVRRLGTTAVSQTADMIHNAAQLTESIMALPLPTDHIIVVFDDRAVPSGYGGANHGFAVSVQQQSELTANEYQQNSLQNTFHHEVSHYWWRGNADWIDEGTADTLAATASLSEGATIPAQPNQRKNCTARNLSEIGDVARANLDQFHCNYYLGEKLFRELQSRMTPQDFTAALQNLYQASQAKVITNQNPIRADIAEVRAAFPAHTDLVNYYWSGDVNAPHRWDPDDNLYKGHNAVVWTQKPTYSNGIVSFSGRLTGAASLSSQRLTDAQEFGRPQNFTVNDAEGNYLGSILPAQSGGRYWILDNPGDVVADTYQLNGNEFSVSFRWPSGAGQYNDKRIIVWGFNNAGRTPQSGSNVDVLGKATVR